MKNCRIYSSCYLPILESAFVYMVLPLHKYTKVITKNKNKPFGKERSPQYRLPQYTQYERLL